MVDLKERIFGVFCFLLVLCVCNYHLFGNGSPTSLIFYQDKVRSGEMYRIISHVLVHVSWYHLFLNALAVMLLWFELSGLCMWKRVSFVSASGVGSLLGANISPHIGLVGFCGLSGVAHGLMSVVGAYWIRQGRVEGNIYRQSAGSFFLLMSLGKSWFEVMAGEVLFDSSHLGYLGLPLVESHLGGVLGGLLLFCAFGAPEKKNREKEKYVLPK